MSPTAHSNPVLLVSVEEYFQARTFRDLAPPTEWEALPSRVERCVDQLFSQLDRFEARATFFFHPWVAERNPALVEQAAEAGHEVGALGDYDVPGRQPSEEEVRARILGARTLLEDRTGRRVLGYRDSLANPEVERRLIWEVLEEAGYTYASGVTPRSWLSSAVGRRNPGGTVAGDGGSVVEVPPTPLRIMGLPALTACGTSLRHLSAEKVVRSLERQAREGGCPVFHMHSWEVDPHQPSLPASAVARFRHYRGLSEMTARLERLLSVFSFDSAAGCFGLGGVAESRRQEGKGEGPVAPDDCRLGATG